MDLVIGNEQKSQALTVYERSQSFFVQTKLPSKRPAVVVAAVIKLLFPYRKFFKTIATDNGVEFMEHLKICMCLNCFIYFADPNCSGQKGCVENINKLFWECFPKGSDFREVSQEEMNKVQYLINKCPRKKSDFNSKKSSKRIY